MTQAEQILAHLEAGKSITPLEALKEYGIFRLGARIYDLKREGHDIEASTIEDARTKKHFASYRLARRRSAA